MQWCSVQRPTHKSNHRTHRVFKRTQTATSKSVYSVSEYLTSCALEIEQGAYVYMNLCEASCEVVPDMMSDQLEMRRSFLR